MKTLREILNSHYPIRNDPYHYHVATSTNFSSKKTNYNAFIHNDDEQKYLAHVTFGNSTTNSDNITNHEKNHVFKVFGSVKKSIEKHIDKNPNITHIQYTSKENEPTRIKLYHAFSKHIDPNYTHRKYPGGIEFTAKVK